MTATRRPKAQRAGTTHPDASHLLAYLRGQELEARWRVIVREHVEQDHCPLCVQTLSELERVTTVLQGLGTRHCQRAYPELTVAQTYARLEARAREGRYRQRPRTAAIRLISIPVAFGLA